jgi:hypothetical protein
VTTDAPVSFTRRFLSLCVGLSSWPLVLYSETITVFWIVMELFWSFSVGFPLSVSPSEDEDSPELVVSSLDESLLDDEVEDAVGFRVVLARVGFESTFPLTGIATFADGAFSLSESLDSLLLEDEFSTLRLLPVRTGAFSRIGAETLTFADFSSSESSLDESLLDDDEVAAFRLTPARDVVEATFCLVGTAGGAFSSSESLDESLPVEELSDDDEELLEELPGDELSDDDELSEELSDDELSDEKVSEDEESATFVRTYGGWSIKHDPSIDWS